MLVWTVALWRLLLPIQLKAAVLVIVAPRRVACHSATQDRSAALSVTHDSKPGRLAEDDLEFKRKRLSQLGLVYGQQRFCRTTVRDAGHEG